MPWDSRQFGIFQLWPKYYETPSSVIMDENVLRKRKIRGGGEKSFGFAESLPKEKTPCIVQSLLPSESNFHSMLACSLTEENPR